MSTGVLAEINGSGLVLVDEVTLGRTAAQRENPIDKELGELVRELIHETGQSQLGGRKWVTLLGSGFDPTVHTGGHAHHQGGVKGITEAAAQIKAVISCDFTRPRRVGRPEEGTVAGLVLEC